MQVVGTGQKAAPLLGFLSASPQRERCLKEATQTSCCRQRFILNFWSLAQGFGVFLWLKPLLFGLAYLGACMLFAFSDCKVLLMSTASFL